MTNHVKVTSRAFPVSYDVGASPTTTFNFDGVFWAASDLRVYVAGVKLDPSAYAVTGLREQAGLPIVGGYGGGTITLNTPVSSVTVVIDRFITDTRDTDFSTTGPLPVDGINSDLDRLTARDQDLEAAIATGGDVIVLPPSSVTSVNAKVGAVVLAASDVGAMPIAGGTFTGPTSGVAPGFHDNSVRLVTSAWVQTELAALAGGVTLATTGTPADPGVAARGVGTTAARADHVHNLPTLAALGAAPAVLTTKGDLVGFSTVPVRLPVGGNGQIIVADSTQAAGVKYTNLDWSLILSKPTTFPPAAHTHPYTDITNFGTGVNASLVAGSGIALTFTGSQVIVAASGGGGGAALDLSNTTIQAASGAQTLPLPAIINRDITLLKFIPQSLHAAIENHTSTVDVTAYIQAALDEANSRGGARVTVEEGLYKVSTTLLIASGTHLQGKGAASKIQTISGVWTPFAGDAIFNHSLFMNRNFGESIIDADIMFSDVWIAGDRNNQAHHLVNMRGVDRPRMHRVKLTDTGGSCTAFLTCKDSVIDSCFAGNAQNAGFDHWDAVDNCKVVNSTVRGIYGQGIQFTATSSPAAARTTFGCLAANNSVYNCIDLGGISADPGWSCGIIWNSADPSATSFNWWGKSRGNHIENCSTGLNFSGKGGMHSSNGDFIRASTVCAVRIGDELGGGDVPDYCTIDALTMADCAYDAVNRIGLISVEGGQQHSIRGLKASGVTTTFAHHVGLAAPTSKCHVFPIETDHASTGSSVNDLGTANKIVTFTGF